MVVKQSHYLPTLPMSGGDLRASDKVYYRKNEVYLEERQVGIWRVHVPKVF
jgi:hypothetical protein